MHIALFSHLPLPSLVIPVQPPAPVVTSVEDDPDCTMNAGQQQQPATDGLLHQCHGPLMMQTLLQRTEEPSQPLQALIDDLRGNCIGQANVVCRSERLARNGNDMCLRKQACGDI